MSVYSTRAMRTALLLVCVLSLVSLVLAGDEYDFDNWTWHAAYGGPVSLGPHTVTFYGRTYNAMTNESTWYYYVESGAAPALSHWVLELCDPLDIWPPPVDPPFTRHYVKGVNEGTTTGPETYTVGYDKFVQITGIKWEGGFSDNESKQQSVTIAGDWEVDYVAVGTKSGGSQVHTGMILGPICTPAEPPDADIELELLFPGFAVDQPLIADWASGNLDVARLGTLVATVTVTGSVSYSADISYAATAISGEPLPDPSSPGFQNSLTYENPNGIWIEIPPGSVGTVALDGMSGMVNKTEQYPIRVRLDILGDRQSGDVIRFDLTVKLTVTANL